MPLRPLPLRLLAVLVLLAAGVALSPELRRAALASSEHADEQAGHPDEHAEHPDERPEHSDERGEGAEFTVAALAKHGVEVATAGPGQVDASIELPGEVRPNGDRIAHLSPRFAGVAREVRKRVGDAVAAGEVMAVIEGEKLSRFPLEAAFAGTVIDRHVTPGEFVTPERAAFIVADLSTVWVEIDVYQRALERVRPGRPVRIAPGRAVPGAEGVVAYVSPVLDQATRTARARVVLANDDGRWLPGSFVTVLVHDPSDAGVVVPRRAVHRLGPDRVVFVVAGDHFETRPVTLGRVGRSNVAITRGLEPGERYADEGSFLVKAEIAKSAGGHPHAH
jgi:cobalt-zinc-cadmium efflux system membrane fusion protein